MGMGVDMDKISKVEAIVQSPLGAFEVPVKESDDAIILVR